MKLRWSSSICGKISERERERYNSLDYLSGFNRDFSFNHLFFFLVVVVVVLVVNIEARKLNIWCECLCNIVVILLSNRTLKILKGKKRNEERNSYAHEAPAMLNLKPHARFHHSRKWIFFKCENRKWKWKQFTRRMKKNDQKIFEDNKKHIFFLNWLRNSSRSYLEYKFSRICSLKIH